MMRCFGLLFACAIVSCSTASASAVRVWQGELALPVYDEGPPDPNPPFDILSVSRFNYPYTIRDNLTGKSSVHKLRAIYLENEYLRCSVLPDLGGHLYTCLDKISGQPMFYANPSIKKAQIGYRGAWAAFGIEFNFPVSHNWLSLSPVDFGFATHADGSASVTVGAIERVYGMEWRVELTLRPGSTVLEQHVTLSNCSDARHRFYWWNNAAAQVWDDSHVEYPMRFVASHGFTEVQPWPVDAEGRDLSVIRNQTSGPVSYFVHGSREPFMAVWHPHTNTGLAHYADYAQVPAKKIWSWGVDPEGLEWRHALSDNNSAYVEVQAGLFRNQETYAFLEPHETLQFQEYWMPVRQTGGITRANLNGVVNLARADGKLRAALNVNHAIPSAVVELSAGSNMLLRKRVDLDPQHTWAGEVEAPQAQVRFALYDANGAVLLEHTEGKYDWDPVSEIKTGPQPEYGNPDDDELNGRLLVALDNYRRALQQSPGDAVLLKKAGRVAATLLRFSEAANWLRAAQERDTTDTETAYYLGLSEEVLGNDRAAQKAFEAAQRLPQYRAGAALHLAEMLSRAGNAEAARRYMGEARTAAPLDERIAEELAILDAQQAPELLRQFPLSDTLREANGKPDLEHLAADPYRILRVASAYMRCGQHRRALEILSRRYPRVNADESEPGTLPPDENALIAYFRAWVLEQLGEPAQEAYAAASRSSTQYIFPNTVEAWHVLRAAVHANAKDGAAHYLLGTFCFNRGLTDDAVSEWELAEQFRPETPVLNASLGTAYLQVRKDPERALTAFRGGVKADPTNPLLYEGMDSSLSLLQRPATERVSALQLYPQTGAMPEAVAYELALNLAEAKHFDEAMAVFQGRFFAREEGGTTPEQVQAEIRLKRALAEHQDLGGEALGPRAEYLLGRMDAAAGRTDAARAHWEKAAAKTDPGEIVWAWLAAKHLGGTDEQQWNTRLKTALADARGRIDASAYGSFWAYSAGLIELALGDSKAADASFEEALLMPDRMLAHHLVRVARGEVGGG